MTGHQAEKNEETNYETSDVPSPPTLPRVTVEDPSFVFRSDEEIALRKKYRKLSIDSKRNLQLICSRCYLEGRDIDIVPVLNSYLDYCFCLEQEFLAKLKKLRCPLKTDGSRSTAKVSETTKKRDRSEVEGDSAGTAPEPALKRKNVRADTVSNIRKTAKKNGRNNRHVDNTKEEAAPSQEPTSFAGVVSPKKKRTSFAGFFDDKKDEQTANKRAKISNANNEDDDANKKQKKKKGISFDVVNEKDKQPTGFSTPKRRYGSPPPPKRSHSFDDIDDTNQGDASGGDSKPPAQRPNCRLASLDDANESKTDEGDSRAPPSIEEKAAAIVAVRPIAVSAAAIREQTTPPILIRALQESRTFDAFRAQMLQQNDPNAVEEQEQPVPPTLINALQESATFEDFRIRMLNKNNPK